LLCRCQTSDNAAEFRILFLQLGDLRFHSAHTGSNILDRRLLSSRRLRQGKCGNSARGCEDLTYWSHWSELPPKWRRNNEASASGPLQTRGPSVRVPPKADV